eukprot:RCo046957
MEVTLPTTLDPAAPYTQRYAVCPDRDYLNPREREYGEEPPQGYGYGPAFVELPENQLVVTVEQGKDWRLVDEKLLKLTAPSVTIRVFSDEEEPPPGSCIGPRLTSDTVVQAKNPPAAPPSEDPSAAAATEVVAAATVEPDMALGQCYRTRSVVPAGGGVLEWGEAVA